MTHCLPNDCLAADITQPQMRLDLILLLFASCVTANFTAPYAPSGNCEYDVSLHCPPTYPPTLGRFCYQCTSGYYSPLQTIGSVSFCVGMNTGLEIPGTSGPIGSVDCSCEGMTRSGNADGITAYCTTYTYVYVPSGNCAVDLAALCPPTDPPILGRFCVACENEKYKPVQSYGSTSYCVDPSSGYEIPYTRGQVGQVDCSCQAMQTQNNVYGAGSFCAL